MRKRMYTMMVVMITFITVVGLAELALYVYKPPKVRSTVGIVHDYIIKEAIKSCGGEDNFHFIVEVSETMLDGDKYPCSGKYIFGCQDGRKITFNDGAAYCFISESQIQDSLAGRKE